MHENGLDNVTLMKKLKDMQENMDIMKEKNEKDKSLLKSKLSTQKEMLKETQKKLKELFHNVYKPLMKEVEIKD